MTAFDYAWGATPRDDGHWHFRLWAPGVPELTLALGDAEIPMALEAEGWFSVTAAAETGTPYRFLLPGGQAVPDPAARWQKGGVHGPSLLCAPRHHREWRGRPWEEAVIYELHVGTFTEEGTFRAAAEQFDRLAGLGITAVELMPVAQFAGDRGWGYDGVLPYAPHPAYGAPDDLAALIDAAHARGLMVLLDVVYNHFGPEGNYLHAYAPAFFDETRHTPWGAGIDYTRPAVRRFFIENALYWLHEYGFDGLRLDAIDQIADPSYPDILVELAREARTRLPGRCVHLTTEDNRNITRLHERGTEGTAVLYTAEWNDDFHNAAHVLATGEREGYYAAYADDPLAHFGRALAEGYAFQGEGGRGEPSAHLPPRAFVDFLQNHDQTGNRAFGERLTTLAQPEMLTALTAILILSPHIPMLFMGEDYGETRPFRFFAGFEGDLARAVTEGRRREFAAFAGFGHESEIPDPIDPETFRGSKLDPARRDSAEGRAVAARLAHLLGLRREHIAPRLGHSNGGAGRLLDARDGILAVDWQLDGALLQLRANLGTARRDLPPVEGAELHRVGEPGAPASVLHAIRSTA